MVIGTHCVAVCITYVHIVGGYITWLVDTGVSDGWRWHSDVVYMDLVTYRLLYVHCDTRYRHELYVENRYSNTKCVILQETHENHEFHPWMWAFYPHPPPHTHSGSELGGNDENPILGFWQKIKSEIVCIWRS